MIMQGKNIPAGTITPEVIQVKTNQTTKNIPTFNSLNYRASLMKDLIVFICDSKNKVANLSNVFVTFYSSVEWSV